MTVEIQLTRGYVAIVDDCDADLAEFNWRALPKSNGVYAMRSNKSTLLHRVIIVRMLNRPLEKGEVVDHIDGNPSNCVRSNLRVATQSQNIACRRTVGGNKDGLRGVRRRKECKRCTAVINILGKRMNLGLFNTPIEAHRAYCIAAIKHYGEFAGFGSNSPFLGWTLEMFESPAVQLPLPLKDAA